MNAKLLALLSQKSGDQAREFETRIQFIGEPYTPGAGILSQAITIEATSSQAVRIHKSEIKQIKIDITSGTATGKKIKSADGSVVGAVDASITVPVVNGRADIIFEATSTGDWALGLDGSVDARAAVLTTTDVGNGTFS